VRTTLTLADDVLAAIEKIRRERGIGLSEAVNELIRAGLAQREARKPFRQKTYDMGKAFVDYSNVWDAIETVDGPASR
jgi:metal-responsive CopG/Arc/MetJ family transcriptional regulator